jgi:hypothetical protein
MGLINWLKTGKWTPALPPASFRSGPAYIKAEPEPQPNAETQEAIRAAEAGETKSFSNVADLIADLNDEQPAKVGKEAEASPAMGKEAEVTPVRTPWREVLPPFIPAEATSLITRTAYRTGYTDSVNYFEVRYNKEARRNPYQVFKIQSQNNQRDYALGFGSFDKAVNYARHAAESTDWDLEPPVEDNKGYTPNGREL